MFEVGDKVMVNSFNSPIGGVIVSWCYDEGNVWVVKMTDGRTLEFSDNDLDPA